MVKGQGSNWESPKRGALEGEAALDHPICVSHPRHYTAWHTHSSCVHTHSHILYVHTHTLVHACTLTHMHTHICDTLVRAHTHICAMHTHSLSHSHRYRGLCPPLQIRLLLQGSQSRKVASHLMDRGQRSREFIRDGGAARGQCHSGGVSVLVGDRPVGDSPGSVWAR